MIDLFGIIVHSCINGSRRQTLKLTKLITWYHQSHHTLFIIWCMKRFFKDDRKLLSSIYDFQVYPQLSYVFIILKDDYLCLISKVTNEIEDKGFTVPIELLDIRSFTFIWLPTLFSNNYEHFDLSLSIWLSFLNDDPLESNDYFEWFFLLKFKSKLQVSYFTAFIL